MVQPGINPETRTYSDYESVNECMEGVCKIYEEHLKRRNPNTPTITYDISQLFDFVDQVGARKSCIKTHIYCETSFTNNVTINFLFYIIFHSCICFHIKYDYVLIIENMNEYSEIV